MSSNRIQKRLFTRARAAEINLPGAINYFLKLLQSIFAPEFQPSIHALSFARARVYENKLFFNTCMKKALLRRKVKRKSNISSVCRGLPQQWLEKYFSYRSYFSFRYSGRKSSLSPAIWRLDIPDLPFTFHAKKVLFLHLLKKYYV